MNGNHQYQYFRFFLHGVNFTLEKSKKTIQKKIEDIYGSFIKYVVGVQNHYC